MLCCANLAAETLLRNARNRLAGWTFVAPPGGLGNLGGRSRVVQVKLEMPCRDDILILHDITSPSQST